LPDRLTDDNPCLSISAVIYNGVAECFLIKSAQSQTLLQRRDPLAFHQFEQRQERHNHFQPGRILSAQGVERGVMFLFQPVGNGQSRAAAAELARLHNYYRAIFSKTHAESSAVTLTPRTCIKV